MSQGRGLAFLGLAWATIFVAFATATGWDRFASPDSLQNLLRQATIVSMASIGATFVIVRGAIDLSVGSSVALVTVVTAAVLRDGGHPVLAAVSGVATAVMVGGLNGGLVRAQRISPFIATLGTLLVVRGLAKGLAQDQKIDAPLSMLRWLTAKVPAGSSWMLVPPGVWITLASAVLAAVVLKRSVFGRNIVASGSNETAAHMAGIATGASMVGAFLVGGLAAGMAGLLQFSRLTVGDPTVAVGLELDVIAAVVIGGASLSGGRGSVAGSLLGALVMATIRAGCSQWGLPNWVQEITTGAIIVLAVALDRVRAREPVQI
ncbi:MAG: ABC transporter permease [Fimbriimonadaceae bacterium]|nr:ABC transporter permease [Fimbriimonadaceae bacterium]